MKKKKPFNPKKNRVEYHCVEQANRKWKVQRLTIRANDTYATATVFKNGTREEAEHYQLLASRGH